MLQYVCLMSNLRNAKCHISYSYIPSSICTFILRKRHVILSKFIVKSHTIRAMPTSEGMYGAMYLHVVVVVVYTFLPVP